MTRQDLLPAILSLSREERLSLMEDIWDSLTDEAIAADDWPPLTAAQREELDRRLDEAERNPGVGKSWEEVEAGILAKLGTIRKK